MPPATRAGFWAAAALAAVVALATFVGAGWWSRGSFDDYPRYYLGHIPDAGDVQVYLCACGSPARHGVGGLHPALPRGRLSVGFFDQAARGREDYVYLGEMPDGIAPALHAIEARATGRWKGKSPRRAAVFADADVPGATRRAVVRRLRAMGAEEVYDGMDPRPSN